MNMVPQAQQQLCRVVDAFMQGGNPRHLYLLQPLVPFDVWARLSKGMGYYRRTGDAEKLYAVCRELTTQYCNDK